MSIHNAARTGNLNRVRTLLNQGVPVNTRDGHGWTPFHWAAFSGRLNVVQELLRRGARVNPRSNHGQTPLLIASRYGHPRVVHELLKAGANPKFRSQRGNAPYNGIFHVLTGNALKTSRAATKWLETTRKRKAENYRKKSIARRRASPNTLARTVFSPARVRTMMKQYGNNWLNKV